jgi:hypothetical protein
MGMRQRLNEIFSRQVSGATSRLTTGQPPLYSVPLPSPAPVAVLEVRENISRGQVVARHSIYGMSGGNSVTLAQGTTFGYKRLYRIPTVTVTHLSLRIDEFLADPGMVELRAWSGV